MAKKPSPNIPAKAEPQTAALVNYADYEGAGFENQTQDDLLIPFINLLQTNSPLVEEREDAKPGMFFNTVTEEVSTELLVVPAFTRHEFVAWVPREKGGGFAGTYAPNCEEVILAKEQAPEFNALTLPNGNELQETFTVYCVLTTEAGDVAGMAVVPFASTKIKAYRKFMSRLRMFQPKRQDGTRFTPPLFAYVARMRSVKDENQHGKFYNVSLEAAVDNDLASSLLNADDPRFVAGADLYHMVKSGEATANYEKMAPAGGAGDSEEAPF